MLDFIPENLQTILIVVVLALLFLAVMKNNKRNQSKMRDRKRRSFRADYFERKNQRDQGDNSSN